ncbi:MAG: L,D-transpeptidase family protein [Campylobacterota bacterium]|nr:L,D-transpeptidase family protein [Campylobacterota bacterium]
MKLELKSIAIALWLSLGTAHAAVADYQEIYQKEHQEFNQKMSAEIEKSVKSSSKKVQELYREINYQPVWVDKDYLTQYAELLLHELKDDFHKGLHIELVETYEQLLPNDQHIFTSDSLHHKVEVEVGLMQLYLEHIEAILKAKKSKHTPLSLLRHALEEKSLTQALNTISQERIEHRTAMIDQNMTIIKESEKMDRDHIKMLTKGSDKERLKAMYDLLHYRPIWITETGLSSYTNSLFRQIESDITFDKNSAAYKSYQRLKAIDTPKDKKKIIAYEFKIAKLYQEYMSHLLYGSIDWKAFQAKLRHKKSADWVVHNVLSSPESLLIEAISHESLDHAFREATPKFPLYGRLVMALKKYQDIANAGGWESLPEFKDLKPGMSDPIVPALRERLAKEGDYVPCDESSTTEHYDKCLVDAVKNFQSRHGLESEGYIGKMTRKALSESAEDKVARIKLNLDRMKWVKRSQDRYQIWVNIPEYAMVVHDGDKQIQKMRVIVGRKGHHTPIFYGRIRTIVLNPYWRIPASIIRGEIIPKLQRDPNYTNSKHIEIHTGYSENSKRVNPNSIDWHKYGRKLPPYRFMQSPGKHNALGKIKYLFPNKYSVYMHDTNQPYLFSKNVRSLSHGCIRLHKPVELLETFSIMDKRVDFEKAHKTLEHNKKRPLRLTHSIPIDTIYLTAWMDEDGTVAFRDDIYGYDKMQLTVSDKQ